MVDATMGLANFGTHHFFLKKFFSMRILNLKLKLLLFLVLPLAACYVEYLYGFLWPLCPFVPEMADAVSQSLERMIGGQKRALDAITSSIAGWEFRRKSGNADPLVLAISGPPGVGKSETGFRIAEAIFGMSTTTGTSRTKPTGVLTIAGGDFVCGIEADVAYTTCTAAEIGPLSTLEGLLHQYMQPWRPDQVAHVGIVESSDDTSHQWNKIRLNWAQHSAHGTGSTGTEPAQGFKRKTEVYFQWCALQEEMVGPHPVISMEATLSKTCETKRFSYDL